MKGTVLLSRSARVLPLASGYDYSQLVSSLRGQVLEQTEAIHAMLAHTAAAAIQIGLRLQFVRDRIGRDRFQDWLEAEFRWSQATASKFMCMARAFGDLDDVRNFDYSALYLLARKKVSHEARETAIDLARRGEFICKSRALAIIAGKEPSVESKTWTVERVRDGIAALLERALKELAEADRQQAISELRTLVQQLEQLPGEASMPAAGGDCGPTDTVP